jgi:hypothetical protein
MSWMAGPTVPPICGEAQAKLTQGLGKFEQYLMVHVVLPVHLS